MCRVLANFSGLTGFNGRLRLESRQEVVYKMLDSFPIQSLLYMSVRVSEFVDGSVYTFEMGITLSS